MGVGMLALPSAMASAGIVGGTAMLCVAAVIATFGSHLLAECVDRVGRPATLSNLTERALGRFGIVLVDLSAVIIGTSCAIGYLIVVGDTLPEIREWLLVDADDASIFAAREFWILAACPIIAPLAFLRRIDSLRFASLVVVGCVAIIIVTVILFAVEPSALFDPCADFAEPAARAFASSHSSAPAESVACRGEVRLGGDGPRTLGALPTCLFAFAAQINVPSIASELRDPTPRRVLATLVGGTCLTVFGYLVVAIGGYATYGSRVTGDLLISYPRAAVIARVALVFVVILSHPVVSYPVSGCISNSASILSAAVGCRKQRARITGGGGAGGGVVGGGRSANETTGGMAAQEDEAASTTQVSAPSLALPKAPAHEQVEGSVQETAAEAHTPESHAPEAHAEAHAQQEMRGHALAQVQAQQLEEEAARAQEQAARTEAKAPTLLEQPSDPNGGTTFVTERRKAFVIAMYLFTTTVIALNVTDLGIVVALAGAVAATTLVFIAPGACYYMLFRERRPGAKTKLAALLAMAGCALLPLLVLLVLASRGYFGEAWAVA